MRRTAFLTLLSALILLSGCGNSALLTLGKDEKFKTSVENTQKKQLRSYFETLAIFRATYLNPVFPEEYNDKQYFFIGIYIQNDMKRKKAGLNNPQFTLSLNDQNATSVTELDENSVLYKRMPLVERWAHYYVIGFDDNVSDNLEITYKKDTNESLKFTFPRYKGN